MFCELAACCYSPAALTLLEIFHQACITWDDSGNVIQRIHPTKWNHDVICAVCLSLSRRVTVQLLYRTGLQ